MVGEPTQIATGLAQDLIQRLHKVALSLHDASSVPANAEVREQIGSALDGLDEMIRTVRLAASGPSPELGDFERADAALAELLVEVGVCARGELPLPDREQLTEWLRLLNQVAGPDGERG